MSVCLCVCVVYLLHYSLFHNDRETNDRSFAHTNDLDTKKQELIEEKMEIQMKKKWKYSA